MRLRQIRLAEQSRRLSEQKLSIEVDKMRAGRSSNFQLVTFQNDLINAQNNELDAVVAYLNALADLERATGVTLSRWGIEIERRYENDYRR
jgi:outer membrane protein